MNKTEIKQVELNEINQLQEIGKKTFVENLPSDKKEEEIQAYLDEKFSAVNLEKELSDTDSLFYFAVLDDRIIGYIKVSEASQTN